MKFIKNVLFDIKNGMAKHYLLFICPAILAILVSLDGIRRINEYVEVTNDISAECTFGNIWFYIYGGMEKYVQSPINPFKFPTIWTTVLAVCSLLVLIYPTKDMLGIGAYTLVAGGSRGKWWFSKIIWNVLSTLIYHGIIMLMVVFICLISGIKINAELNMNLQMSLYEIVDISPFKEFNTIPISVFLLTIFMSIAMNLFQMTLTLFINPNYSFIISCFLLMGSAYILTPAMVYNYAIPLRYSLLFEGGINYIYGYVVALAVTLLSIVIGYIRFLKYDIIKKEDN